MALTRDSVVPLAERMLDGVAPEIRIAEGRDDFDTLMLAGAAVALAFAHLYLKSKGNGTQ
jgi:hypothetical protein